MSGKTALIIVDVQKDFLPGGSLAVPGGDAVIEPLIKLAQDADVLVFTRDMHPEDHCSFADNPAYCDGSWPAHCVAGTEGAQGIPAFNDTIMSFTGRLFMADKGRDKNLEAYSGFDGTISAYAASTDDVIRLDFDSIIGDKFIDRPLGDVLRESEVSKVIIGGLALDWCVKATALDAIDEGFDTTVVLVATREVSLDTGAAAVIEMSQEGVHIV